PDMTDGAASWCSVTWIDDGAMGSTLAGDENTKRIYIRHNTAHGAPDHVYFGYGRTANLDDNTWNWLPVTAYGLVNDGADFEYTGHVGRASAGDYVVAAKFIKGRHVYYNPPELGSWGDWGTRLFATNRWTVIPLTAPSNGCARFASTNQIDVEFSSDNVHWVQIFRKQGESASFVPPVDGVTYYQGDTYADQGSCIYRGAAVLLEDTGLLDRTVFQYRLYTENYSYYSTGIILAASTDPDRDDDSDQMPNAWEVRYHFNPGDPSDGGGDQDLDQLFNWQEFTAGTDPTLDSSVFEVEGGLAVQSAASVFSWSSETGKYYTVWAITNLLRGGRSAVVSHLAATPPVNSYTNPASAGDVKIYVVEVER
ncbi:MAG: hypothetical protein V2A34_12610, partial [Lentisphaerota bacterium]